MSRWRETKLAVGFFVVVGLCIAGPEYILPLLEKGGLALGAAVVVVLIVAYAALRGTAPADEG